MPGETDKPQLQTSDVGGLRTFYVDTGQTPSAELQFRVGYADESLVQHGWTHLLEHVAMHDLPHRRATVNGNVGRFITTFNVQGEYADVKTFLQRLCSWLSTPDLSALQHERAIVVAEERQRGRSDTTMHFDLRYGPHGPGLANYDEFGVTHADPGQLARWAARHFTRQNAALALNFPPPDDLALPLPEGDLVPVRAVQHLDIGLPAHSLGVSNHVAMSVLVPDDPAPAVRSLLPNLACSVLEEAVEQHLRHHLAVTYDVTASVETVDQDHQMVFLAADLDPAAAADGVQHLHDVLTDLDRVGVDPTALSETCERVIRDLRDAAGDWQAQVSASSALHGRQPVTFDNVVAAFRAVTATQIEDMLRAAHGTLLATSPAGLGSVTELPFTTGMPTLRAPAGARRFLATGAPGDRSQLWFSPEVVEMREGDAQLGVGLPDAAAVLAYPDGGRHVVSDAGVVLPVEPTSWWRGHKLVELVDRHTPPGTHIPLARYDGSPPPPAMTVMRWVRMNRQLAGALLVLVVFAMIALATL